MPEITTIALSLLGLFGVGLAFTALRLIKNVTQFIAISLFMAFIILLANRSFNPSFGDLAIFSPNRPPIQTDRQPSLSPSIQDYQRAGRELVSGFSKNTGNLSDSLDTFVYGPQAKIGWQKLPKNLYAQQHQFNRTSTQASQRPISAPSSNQTSPSTPSTTTPTARPAPAQRPISAWW
jgi:hypothetical protein